jgi:methyltransferase-like protein 23
MSISLQLQHLQKPGYSIELFVPNAQQVQELYFEQKQDQVPFPHWTKLWPAALAMSDFIYQHPELVQDKNVLELAAGLGLPSFIAARYARSVCCSDYIDEAVSTMAKSAHHLQLSNVTCRTLDWNYLPDDLTADVLLLSDINYNPEQFERLYVVVLRFLRQGTHILLATPQRLVGKPFIEKLMPFCTEQYELLTDDMQKQTVVSLLLLQKQV